MKAKFNKTNILVTEASIFSLTADAIVNPTDTMLSPNPALIERAGQTLAEELHIIGWCDIGASVVTSGGNLPFKHIIHVVGPRWGDDNARGKLLKAIWSVLDQTVDFKIKTLAFPIITTNLSGYPVENATRLIVESIYDYSFEPNNTLNLIYLVANSSSEFSAFADAIRAVSDDDHARVS